MDLGTRGFVAAAGKAVALVDGFGGVDGEDLCCVSVGFGRGGAEGTYACPTNEPTHSACDDDGKGMRG